MLTTSRHVVKKHSAGAAVYKSGHPDRRSRFPFDPVCAARAASTYTGGLRVCSGVMRTSNLPVSMRVDHRNDTHSNIVEDLRCIVLAAEIKQSRETERVYEGGGGGGGGKGRLKTFFIVDDVGAAAD